VHLRVGNAVAAPLLECEQRLLFVCPIRVRRLAVPRCVSDLDSLERMQYECKCSGRLTRHSVQKPCVVSSVHELAGLFINYIEHALGCTTRQVTSARTSFSVVTLL
jgi:hypothetical protein